MNYFYFDNHGQKYGPVTQEQLQSLVQQRIINPQTPLETDGGYSGLASQIPGLFPAATTVLNSTRPVPPTFDLGTAAPPQVVPLPGLRPHRSYTVWLIFLFIAVIGICIGAVIGLQKFGDMYESDVIKISKMQLSSEYAGNEIAADNSYKGKQLAVTGFVEEIGKDTIGTMYVIVTSDFQKSISLESFKLHVSCFFPDSASKPLSHIAKADRITIQGRCDGVKEGKIILTNCKIVEDNTNSVKFTATESALSREEKELPLTVKVDNPPITFAIQEPEYSASEGECVLIVQNNGDTSLCFTALIGNRNFYCGGLPPHKRYVKSVPHDLIHTPLFNVDRRERYYLGVAIEIEGYAPIQQRYTLKKSNDKSNKIAANKIEVLPDKGNERADDEVEIIRIRQQAQTEAEKFVGIAEAAAEEAESESAPKRQPIQFPSRRAAISFSLNERESFVGFSADSKKVLTNKPMKMKWVENLNKFVDIPEEDSETSRVLDAATGNFLYKVEGVIDESHIGFVDGGKKVFVIESERDGRNIHFIGGKMFDGETGRELYKTGYVTSLKNVIISPDGKIVRLYRVPNGRSGETDTFLDAETGKQLYEIKQMSFFDIQFSTDGKRVFVWERDSRTARFLDAATGQEQHKIVIDSGTSLCFSANGKKVAVGNIRETTSRILDAVTGKELLQIEGVPYIFYNDDKMLLVGDIRNGKATFLNSETGMKLGADFTLPFGTQHVFSNDHRKLAVIDRRPGVNITNVQVPVYDVTTGMLLYKIEKATVKFSADGKTVLASNHDAGTLRILDIESGKELNQFKELINPHRAELTTDGKRIALQVRSFNWTIQNSDEMQITAPAMEFRQPDRAENPQGDDPVPLFPFPARRGNGGGGVPPVRGGRPGDARQPLQGFNEAERTALDKFAMKYDFNINTINLKTVDNKVGGKTLLHQAAKDGVIPAAKFLVDNGANVDIKDDKGETPLHEAVRSKKIDFAAYLVDKGADVNAEDKAGNTPLHLMATIKGADIEFIKFLVGNGARVNEPDVQGRTPLHRLAAMQFGDIEFAKVLVANGADADITYNDGKGKKTAFDKAKESKNKAMEDFLSSEVVKKFLKSDEAKKYVVPKNLPPK